MSIRRVLILLSLLGFGGAAVGGLVFYSIIGNIHSREAHRSAALVVDGSANRISENLYGVRRATALLARQVEMAGVLEGEDAPDLSTLNIVLDNYREELDAGVCYMMVRSGETIASSNRNSPKSFVGKNYSFRPYFRDAINGKPGRYAAVGVTSGTPGLYFSHPVWSDDGDAVLGVVVIKVAVDVIQEELNRFDEGAAVLISPDSVVFVSNQASWRYGFLFQPSKETMNRVDRSRQFDAGGAVWVGAQRTGAEAAVDTSGSAYHLHTGRIEPLGEGWELIYLHNRQIVADRAKGAAIRSFGVMMVVVCLLLGMVTVYLYRRASRDLEKEERYRVLFENAKEAVFIAQDGFVKFPNPQTLALHGYTEEEITRVPFLEFIHGDDREMVVDRYQRRIAGEDVPSTYSYRIVTQKGEVRWVELNVAAINWEGAPATLCFMMDITDRHEADEALRQSEEQLRAVVTTANDAVILLDDSGRIQLWNPAAEAIFQYDRTEALGKNLHQLLAPERYHEAHARGFEDFRATGEGTAIGTTLELDAVRKDGEEFAVELSLSSLQKDGRWFAVGFVRDISIRRSAEAERERLIAELQSALAEVKTLSGLLPVCANCKSIRDDKGYWNKIETFISERSGAEFTHSICPRCEEELYPELAGD